MKRKSGLLFIVFISLLIIGGCYYYFEIYKEEVVNDTPPIEKIDETSTINSIDCENGYFCETINDIDYSWTIKTKINLVNIYNYDKDELEAGTLEINEEGKLVFLDLKKDVLKSYDEITSKVVSIESSVDSCEDSLIYLALTEDGSIYMTDAHNGLLVSEAFFKIESKNKYVAFSTKVNKTDYVCTITEIYAKMIDGKVDKLVSNENVTQ